MDTELEIQLGRRNVLKVGGFQAKNRKDGFGIKSFTQVSVDSLLFSLSRSGPGRADVHQRHTGGEAGSLRRHVRGRSSHRHELWAARNKLNSRETITMRDITCFRSQCQLSIITSQPVHQITDSNQTDQKHVNKHQRHENELRRQKHLYLEFLVWFMFHLLNVNVLLSDSFIVEFITFGILWKMLKLNKLDWLNVFSMFSIWSERSSRSHWFLRQRWSRPTRMPQNHLCR